MSTRLLILTAGSVIAVTCAVVLASAHPADASTAERYFGCPAGYAFQVNGSSARCFVAGTSSTADILCGVGYVKALDQSSAGRDACQNKLTNIVGNYTCPAGYTPKVQPGPDFCLKPASPSIIAPAVEKYL